MQPTPDASTAQPARRDVGSLALSAALLLAALARAAYHLAWLARAPFARGTFADGRWYELAARDLLARPPLGTQPFYLQGLYAAQLALGLGLTGSLRGALALQVLAYGAALALVYRAATRAFGRLEGALGTLALLLCAGTAFYENKPLSAGLGFALSGCLFAALVHALEAPRPSRAALLGATFGLAVLARPHALLVAPFLAVPLARAASSRRLALLSAAMLGAVLAVAPMATRNALLTGRPTVLREHGAAAALFAGNNPRARGLWSGGGVLSGDVTRELREAADAFSLPAGPERDAQAARELERRAWAFLREDPARAAALLGRKLWLAAGNEEFSQDFDWRGEREFVPFGLPWSAPFGALLGLGALGLWLLPRASPEHPEPSGSLRRGASWALLGLFAAPLCAQLLYFTSSQHRLFLALPLGLAAGPALRWLYLAARGRRLRSLAAGLAVVLLLAGQAMVPRGRARAAGPPTVYLFNLALVYDQLGERADARRVLAQALSRPNAPPLLRLVWAQWQLRDGDLAGARATVQALEANPEARADASLRGRLRALSAQLEATP